jgi:hypothetical protein
MADMLAYSMLENLDLRLWEEKSPGASISNRIADRRCVEAGTKNRYSEGKINVRGGGQKIAPASPRQV